MVIKRNVSSLTAETVLATQRWVYDAPVHMALDTWDPATVEAVQLVSLAQQLGTRVHDVEHIIAKHDAIAAVYAIDVIGGRFHEAEEVIVGGRNEALVYIDACVAEPAPDLEELLIHHPRWWERYTEKFPDRGAFLAAHRAGK